MLQLLRLVKKDCATILLPMYLLEAPVMGYVVPLCKGMYVNVKAFLPSILFYVAWLILLLIDQNFFNTQKYTFQIHIKAKGN
jgi:hypothetical protein